jgi:hypothetical protein
MDGEYTVCSGYDFAKEGAIRNEGSTFNSSNMSQLWRTVWNFKGPRALKMFLWRACNNILPTKENLYRGKIIDDSKCAICGGDTETLGHVTWSCAAARDVWLENMKSIQKCISDKIDFRQLYEKLCERLKEEDFQRFTFVSRQLWFQWNKAVFEGEFLSPVQVNQIANDQLENYKMAEQEQRNSGGVHISTEVP